MNKSQFTTSELPPRYGVDKSDICSRIEFLHIKTQGQGKKSYITAEQLQLMDDLDAHLKAEGGMDEFIRRCIKEGRIIPPAPGPMITQAQPQDLTAIRNSQAVPTLNPEEAIEHLLTQKDAEVNASDLQETDQRAQYRAAMKAIGEESLTLLYEATQAYTIPGLKDQVEQHCSRIKQIRARRTKGIDQDLNREIINFLSNSLPIQMADGTSGLLPSPNGKKEPADESNISGSRNG